MPFAWQQVRCFWGTDTDMAICNFRADAFGLDSAGTIDLHTIVELLEEAGKGRLAKKDLDPRWAAFFESLKERGLVEERGETYCLKKQGREMLRACRALMQQGDTADACP